MALRSCTTIAAIVLKDPNELGLNTVVAEILQSKIAKHAGAHQITCESDDLLFLNFNGLRIGLYEVAETDETPKTLCIAVGPVSSTRLPKHLDSSRIAHALVKKVNRILTVQAVLWHDYQRPLNKQVIEDFRFELDKMLGYLELQMHGTRTRKTPVEKARTIRLRDDVALDALRGKLRKRGMVGDPVSLPLHVSLYILAVTFFFMIPALGSTLLSYIWLRDGVDKPKRSA